MSFHKNPKFSVKNISGSIVIKSLNSEFDLLKDYIFKKYGLLNNQEIYLFLSSLPFTVNNEDFSNKSFFKEIEIEIFEMDPIFKYLGIPHA
jgi:hypothetical protein